MSYDDQLPRPRMNGASPRVDGYRPRPAALERRGLTGWRVRYLAVVSLLLHGGFAVFARAAYATPPFLAGILLLNLIVAVDIFVRPAAVGEQLEPGWYRPAAALVAGAFFLMPYLEHTALAWPLPEWVSLIGLAGLAAAGGLVVVCRLTNRFTIGTLSIVEGHALYRAGVYGVVRHPIYAALIGGTLAYGLVFRAPLTAALGALAVYAGFRARIRTEEKMLESHFGEQYVDYRRTTGAFFPRVLPQLTEAVRRRR